MSQAIVSDNTSDHKYMNNFLGALYDKDKNTLEWDYTYAKIFCASYKYILIIFKFIKELPPIIHMNTILW